MRVLPNKSQVKTISLFALGMVAGIGFMVAKTNYEELLEPLVIEHTVIVKESDAFGEISELVEKGDVKSQTKLLEIGRDAVDAVDAIQ